MRRLRRRGPPLVLLALVGPFVPWSHGRAMALTAQGAQEAQEPAAPDSPKASASALPSTAPEVGMAAPAVAGAAAGLWSDGILAAVDGDPILESELARLFALGILSRQEGESDAALRRRALDRMIDNRLRLHELDRFGYDEAPLDEIDRRYRRIRERFASEPEFQAELARLDLDDARLRVLIARQVAILAYVEERLGPRVFVGVEDIRRYFDEELVPQLAAEGKGAPAIESVREAIRGVLRERRLNEEIDRWTSDLRAKADVEDFLDVKPAPPPPVVGRVGAEPSP